jgi:hypothetical protein
MGAAKKTRTRLDNTRKTMLFNFTYIDGDAVLGDISYRRSRDEREHRNERRNSKRERESELEQGRRNSTGLVLKLVAAPPHARGPRPRFPAGFYK